MAFSGGNSSVGLRRGRFRGTSSMSEINIVPLVDVVLVLLIIFMLTAHVMEFGLEVEVPKVKQVKESVQDLPVITVTRDGTTYLSDKPTNINLLASEIRRRYRNAQAAYVRADKGTPWEQVAQVIAMLGEAKMGVNMVTQPEDQTGKRR
ncbi:MAG TPA: biopolymer transporter ExbD [Bryobacteraceae bacterium]|nr:biopolymer transporter ExbD [Bryobacteraceae bacterium]